MGEPKALLKWNHSATFIEKIINEFHQFGCGKIICIINEKIDQFCKELKAEQNVKFIVNQHPEWGRFNSIKLGAAEAAGSDFCFIHNIDNPFVNYRTIEKLYTRSDANAWCSPVYQGKSGHPVLLPEFIINKINEAGDLNIILSDILKDYPVIRTEVEDDSILRNINTPEDYHKYIKSGL